MLQSVAIALPISNNFLCPYDRCCASSSFFYKPDLFQHIVCSVIVNLCMSFKQGSEYGSFCEGYEYVIKNGHLFKNLNILKGSGDAECFNIMRIDVFNFYGITEYQCTGIFG